MAVDLEAEYGRIQEVANRYGVDPRFIAAIRLQENGPPGLEFGVKSVPAPTYEEQLRVTCASVRNHIFRYGLLPYERPRPPAVRLQYSAGFIRSFGLRWSPPESHTVNRLWIPNVLRIYGRLVMEL